MENDNYDDSQDLELFPIFLSQVSQDFTYEFYKNDISTNIREINTKIVKTNELTTQV